MKVDNDTMLRVIWKLSNLYPTRYYCDGKHDGSFSHWKILLTLNSAEPRPNRLLAELEAMGFSYTLECANNSVVCISLLAERELKYGEQQTT